MPEFRPLRVTAWLQTAIVTNAYLSLDGPLYALLMRETHGWPIASEGGLPSEACKPAAALPLAVVHPESPHWYYACSAGQWPADYIDVQSHWHKRIPVHRAGLLKPGSGQRVEVATGRYRSYRMPVFTRHVLMITWFCRGDLIALERLLPHLTHLGKKASQGWGSILRWDIAPIAEDWSCIDAAGTCMRACPAQEGTPITPTMLWHGYRPPYWMPQNQHLCTLPPGMMA